MIKYLFFVVFLSSFSIVGHAQTREELDRQLTQLRKEIEETEKQLKNNKAQTQEGLLQWRLINNKTGLQSKVVENINKDLRILSNNIYTIQKDINRYDHILDTLKKEYAKSMVYAYKNRGNYQFLNFIFSASSFNDAIKRISYLKSYRNYQEIQGENILRTQELRRRKIAELSGNKKEKSTTLQTQSRELSILEEQEKEKDRIVAELKKQGKTLNNQIASKKQQQQKVKNAIAAAIKKAQEQARKEALAKAAEAERKRKEQEKADALAAAAKNATKENNNASTPVKVEATPAKPTPAPVKVSAVSDASVLLNAGNTKLNSDFEKNRGILPWPVDKGLVLMHFGLNKLPSGGDINSSSLTISTEIGTAVKSVFEGTVSAVLPIDGMDVVIIQHGKYFTTYSNLSGVNIKAGQDVKTGQTIGRVAADLQGNGSIDFFMSNENSSFDPERWLKNK